MVSVLFLGKDKPVVRRALKYLSDDPGFDVVGVVSPPGGLADTAGQLGLRALTHDEAHGRPWDGVDLAVSYLYPRLMRASVIRDPRLGCINFHPAPLPKYRGVAPYSRAILDGESTYGVSVHFVDEDFDSGDLIEVTAFEIDPTQVTALALERRASCELFELFRRVLADIKAGRPLPRVPQRGSRFIYTSKGDLERLRAVDVNDSAEVISRKIRAFFFPPHGGAFLKLDGREFTLLDDERLAEIARWHDDLPRHG